MGSLAFSPKRVFSLLLVIALAGMSGRMYESALGENVGMFFVVAALILSNLILVGQLANKKRVSKSLFMLLVGILLFYLVYVLAYFLVDRGDFVHVKVLSQTILSLNYFLFVCLFDWTKSELRWMSVVFLAFVLVVAVYTVWIGFSLKYSAFFANANAFGAYNFFIGFFFVALALETRGSEKKFWQLAASIAFFFVLLSCSRSVWMATVACGATFGLWPVISRWKTLFFSYLVVGLLVIVAIIILLPSDLVIDSLSPLNEFSLKYMGARATTGRERLWPLLLYQASRSILLGYGPGAQPTDFFYVREISSHNLYLQILLQVGAVGLTSLALLFFCIWQLFWKGRHHARVRLCASFFVALLIHQCFEVNLTQNNLAIGLLVWTVVGIGVSRSLRQTAPSVLSGATVAQQKRPAFPPRLDLPFASRQHRGAG